MIIDSTDLKTLGLAVKSRGASRSTARIVDAFAEIPGAWTSRRLGRGPVQAKPITLTGYITGSSLSNLRTNIDVITWYLRPQTSHTLRWSDDSSREWVVYFSEMIVRGLEPEWTVQASGTAVVEVEVSMMAEDPRGRATSDTDINSAGALPRTLTPTGIGTAPMPAIITLVGSGTALSALTISYRDSSDTVVYSFDWDGTALTGSDTLLIDTGLATVTRNGVNDIANVTDDDGALPFEIDPDDGSYLTPAFPDIYISGTGTANTAKLTYRERYW